MSPLSPERLTHVGSSEVASLFGTGYQSRLELWLKKAGLAEDDNGTHERLEVGSVIESAIAQLAKSRLGLTGNNVRKVYAYRSHSEIEHSGASLDYQLVGSTHTESVRAIVGPDIRGVGLLEIKNVSDWAFRKMWERGEVIPLRYQLQVQQQLSVTGWSWGIIAALVGGNHLHLMPVHRHQGAIDKIEAEIPIFWQSLVEEKPPPPNWEEDSDLVIRIRSIVDDQIEIDLSVDDAANELAERYDFWVRMISNAKDQQKKVKAQLLDKHIGEAGVAHLSRGGRITRRRVKVAAQHREQYEFTNFKVTVGEQNDGP